MCTAGVLIGPILRGRPERGPGEPKGIMTTFQPEPVPGQAPPPDSVHPRDSNAHSPTSVARLGDTIRGFVETWGSVWVEGEITSWNLRGGNVFGRMKDLTTDATISIRIWSMI